MRRLLYSLIFVTVLLLAGYAGLASENEPSGGGTVPGGEHQVWLPVVSLPYRYTGALGDLPEDCPYRAVAFAPENDAVFTFGDIVTFTWTVVGSNGYEIPVDLNSNVVGRWNIEGTRLYSFSRENIVYTRSHLWPGRFEWRIIVTCIVDEQQIRHGISESRFFTLTNGLD